MTSGSCVRHLRGIPIAAVFVFCAAGAGLAQDTPDANKIWTAIGSSGILDKDDAGKVVFFHSIVQMGANLSGGASLAVPHAEQAPRVISPPAQSATVRYNVTPVDGLFSPFLQEAHVTHRGVELMLRYLAVNAQVILRLIEVDFATGQEVVHLSFDSNRFPPSNGYHTETAFSSCFGGFGQVNFDFDFNLKAYYIEATLSTNPIVVGSAAGIQVIKLVRCAPPPATP